MTTSLGLLGKLTTSTEDTSAIFTGQLHVPPFVLRLQHAVDQCTVLLLLLLLLLLLIVTLLLLWVDGVVVCFLCVYAACNFSTLKQFSRTN